MSDNQKMSDKLMVLKIICNQRRH